MKFTIVLVAIFLATCIVYSESSEKYSQIKIFVPDKSALTHIWSTGIDFEGSSGKIGGWMEFVAGSFEKEQLRSQGIPFTIIEDDLSAKYVRSINIEPVNALGFGYGSMGGYYTFQEVKQQLDSMKSRFPNLITKKDSIGRTAQGRAIWITKISSNPSVNDPNKPEVMYTALHHAREPEGMMATVYFMWWLLENYGKDSGATYLVNNRQMYFIPVVNPDGYVYNQSTNPSGGGMWRKNLRNNGDGTYGVDLNRNYGPNDMWNSPYGGSSTYTSSETYRGPSPYSEPEIYAIAEFFGTHSIMSCLNYHTYGNYLIYPWGYQPVETDDSIAFREFAFDMVKDNRFLSGTDPQTVHYTTRGGADDFMYGGSYVRTFAMTPEVGTSGFWPPTNEIFPLAQENLSANIYCSYIAGQYTLLNRYRIINTRGNDDLEPNESFSLMTQLRNKGLGDASNLQVTINSNSPLIQFSSDTININLFPMRSDSSLYFACNVLPTSVEITPIEIFLQITDQDGFFHRDTISLIVGMQSTIMSDSASNGIGQWTAGEGWGTSTNAHSLPYSFTDSPSGNYAGDADNSLTLDRQINLSPYEYAVLRFQTKWAIEPTNDFATVEVSTDGGTNWNSVQTTLSHRGSGFGMQPIGTWGYDGYTPGMDWIEQEADLTQYANKQISLRFRLRSDDGEERDGWYIDDIRLIGYQKSSPTLVIKDNGSLSDALVFGETPSATSGIDIALGETELMPKPSAGTFDARWNIAGTNGTKIDYRKILEIADSSNIFTADFQPGGGGYPLTLKWNRHLLPQGGWHMRDAITHGMNFRINMLSDSDLVITNETIKSVELVHTRLDTLNLTLDAGWHLVSVPMIVEDRTKQSLFPGVPSDAFGYDHSYRTSATIDDHQGYWLKIPSLTSFKMAGIPITEDTIQIPSGWWIISGVDCQIQPSQIRCDNPPCTIFKYSGGYRSDVAVDPGEGFWIKGPMKVILPCFQNAAAAEKKSATAELQSFNRIEITDNLAHSTSLYFGAEQKPGFPLERYDLPPLPPTGSFDARFASSRTVENLDESRKYLKVLLQSSSYPLTIQWNLAPGMDQQFELSDDRDGALIGIQTMSNAGSIVIRNSGVGAIVVKRRSEAVNPIEYSLKQNYPNPFNPSTTIEFDLPASSSVSLKVFDLLGNEVQTLVNDQTFPGGHYKVAFDGSNMSSGIYLYRLNTLSIRESRIYQFNKKMVLLK